MSEQKNVSGLIWVSGTLLTVGAIKLMHKTKIIQKQIERISIKYGGKKDGTKI